MGSGEDNLSIKTSKEAAVPQEMPIPSAYSEWQQYYNAAATPAGFYAATSSHRPYIIQQFMPPYGTPVQFSPIYPHYAPNLPLVQSAAPITSEPEGKTPNRKENRGSKRKSKGCSGNTARVGCKYGESGKEASGSGNDGDAAQSAESGDDGSSDRSHENIDQQDDTTKMDLKILPYGTNAQNNTLVIESSSSARVPLAVSSVSVPGKPATDLNIGMDLWGASPAGAVPFKTRPNASGVSPSVSPMAGCERVAPDVWIQDERELKRQRRKQSNRESARRSRLRKQAECEELQTKVETLKNENDMLKEELTRLSEECVKLSQANASIKEELEQVYGADAVSGFNVDAANLGNEECNNRKQDDVRERHLISAEGGNFFKSNGDVEVE